DMREVSKVKSAIKPETKLVWLETPTNPLLKVADVEGICNIVDRVNEERPKHRKIFSVIDNTFMTPYFLKPFELGTDIVVHSTTKFLSGHNQLVGGMAVIIDDPSKWYYEEREGIVVNGLFEDIKFIQNSVGAVPGPFDCWLTIMGIKTLSLRMERHNSNALKIVKFLLEHPKVQKVHYPGIENHLNHKIAKKQMTGFGGMLSFELKDDFGIDGGIRVMNSVKLWYLAESLGAVESMITHPSSMTHAALPPEIRRERGITDGLIRLSVGIEDPEDLIEDLNRALEKA
ncbi:MAG: PLP-dependent aspartate aminotransferase family protein, partial [Candidatus Heimdallarchaeota archaeon]